LCKWTNDSQRFLLEHIDIIHNSPSHIYHSALPFSPPSSWFHKCYSEELSQEVKVVKGLPAEWGTCSRTVSLNYSGLALSYLNNTIAVGSGGSIIILNAITGIQEAVLSGHKNWVRSITYSPDGVSLVSGSSDKTIKLWDVQTGGVVKTFYGHTDVIYSVSISADCTRIVSGSSDHTIHLWDIQTGECHYVIVQEGNVVCVSFCPTDPQHFLSVCNNQVWQWDINGHQAGPTYDGSYVMFSQDGTQFVSCYEEDVTIQNSSSGVIVNEFQMVDGDIHQCCFSPNGRLVAVANVDTIYVWDITNLEPHLIETFMGHTERIRSLTFSSSSSLISASDDRSVKFWKIGISSNPAEVNPEPISLTSADDRSITLQAKDSTTITSDSDGIIRTWDISSGLCKTSFQTPAKNPYNRSGQLNNKPVFREDVQLINGRLIFVWHADQKINIWDMEEGELLFAVDEPEFLHNLKISGDGSRVFCLSTEFIQAVSIQTGEVVGKVNVNDSFGFLIVDGSRVWVDCGSWGCQGWDFGTPGSSPVQLPNIPPHKLHHNGTMLWDISLSRILEKATGKVVFQLPKRYGEPIDVQWNDQYLVACFAPTEVLILDFSHVFPK